LRYSGLVENIIEVHESYELTGWLAVVDEIHTVTAEDLERLSWHVPDVLSEVSLIPTGLKFDEKMANWFFAATNSWRICEGVTVKELRAVMPPGTVSPRANRVALWTPIKRAFDRSVSKVSKAGDALLTCISGGSKSHLTCLDLGNRLFACSCPAYNSKRENERKRHVLCKHLMLSIYYHNSSVLRRFSMLKKESDWSRSLSLAQFHQHRNVMLCNWLYYFIKKIFAPLSFEAGLFKSQDQVNEILALMEG